MPKMTLKQALKSIFDSYDAFYMPNKYTSVGDGTHANEEKLLKEAFGDDEMSMRALHWIHDQYDCWYKDEYLDKDSHYDSKTPFHYLKTKIEEKEETE